MSLTSVSNKCLYGWKHAVCKLPAGLWADIVLAVTESHLPVLPLPLEGGEGEERGDGLCCDTHWATAKPKCDICACVSQTHRVILSISHIFRLKSFLFSFIYGVCFWRLSFCCPKLRLKLLTWDLIDWGKDRSTGGWIVGRPSWLLVEPERESTGWRVGRLAKTQHLCCTRLHRQVQQSCRQRSFSLLSQQWIAFSKMQNTNSYIWHSAVW